MLGLGVFAYLLYAGAQQLMAFANIPFHDKPKGKTMETCLNGNTFEKAYKYVFWKHHTAKKLSANHQVLFNGYELKAIEEENIGKRLIFSKDGYKSFSVDMQQGYIPHTKVADYQRYEQVFCELVETAQQNGMPNQYTYYYADGNANLWKITEDKVVYTPVKPENSSSGMYSGGEPFEVLITLQQFQEIEQLLLQALKDKTAQQAERTKGTGVVSQQVESALVQKCYLAHPTSHKEAIEKHLQQLKP